MKTRIGYEIIEGETWYKLIPDGWMRPRVPTGYVKLEDIARGAGIEDSEALGDLLLLWNKYLIEVVTLVHHMQHPEKPIAIKPISEGLGNGTYCFECCEWIGNEFLEFDFAVLLEDQWPSSYQHQSR